MVVKKIIKYLKENPKKEVSIGHTGGIKKKALEGDMGFKKSKYDKSGGQSLKDAKAALYDKQKEIRKEWRAMERKNN